MPSGQRAIRSIDGYLRQRNSVDVFIEVCQHSPAQLFSVSRRRSTRSQSPEMFDTPVVTVCYEVAPAVVRHTLQWIVNETSWSVELGTVDRRVAASRPSRTGR